MSWRTRGLAVGRAEVAAEVLGDDDVRGHLRPELRHLDVLLLEDDPARLVGDGRRAQLPLAGVVDVDARLGEEALDVDPAALRSPCGRPSAACADDRGRSVLGHVDGRHVLLLPPTEKRPCAGRFHFLNAISACETSGRGGRGCGTGPLHFDVTWYSRICNETERNGDRVARRDCFKSFILPPSRRDVIDCDNLRPVEHPVKMSRTTRCTTTRKSSQVFAPSMI